MVAVATICEKKYYRVSYLHQVMSVFTLSHHDWDKYGFYG